MPSGEDWRLGELEDAAMQVLGDLYIPFTDEMITRGRSFDIDELVEWLCRYPGYGAGMKALRRIGVFDDDFWKDGVVEFFAQDPRLVEYAEEKWRPAR